MDDSVTFSFNDLFDYLNQSGLTVNLISERNVSQIGSAATPKNLYCGDQLASFHKSYVQVHGYLSLVVCLFGILANSLNVIVLTRKNMISPTNAILTAQAFADNLVMIEYIPFAVHMYVLRQRSLYEKFSYPWTVYVLIHAHVTQVFHTISIWLTLTVGVWRYFSVVHPLSSYQWLTLNRAFLAILFAYVGSPILCMPLYMTFTIQERNITSPQQVNETLTLYFLGTSELARAHHSLLENINFWMYSVVIKIIPCVMLTILSFFLIKALVQARKRRDHLKNRRESMAECSSSQSGPEGEHVDCITKMLLAVLILFLITELPHGILTLLSGILGDAFFSNCYGHLGELMDILALINGAINFMLYYTMSRQFRQTLSCFFRPSILDNCTTLTLPETNIDSVKRCTLIKDISLTTLNMQSLSTIV